MPLSTAKGDLPDIPGGVYEPGRAFEEVSARFALVNRRGELSIIHRTNSGEAETISEDDFRLYLAPVRVTIGDGDKQRSFAWLIGGANTLTGRPFAAPSSSPTRPRRWMNTIFGGVSALIPSRV